MLIRMDAGELVGAGRRRVWLESSPNLIETNGNAVPSELIATSNTAGDTVL